jgi:hypothetical protein
MRSSTTVEFDSPQTPFVYLIATRALHRFEREQIEVVESGITHLDWAPFGTSGICVWLS